MESLSLVKSIKTDSHKLSQTKLRTQHNSAKIGKVFKFKIERLNFLWMK